MRIHATVPVLLACSLLFPAIAADESPYPPGASTQTHEGMEFSLVLPDDYDGNGSYALLIALHGLNGKGASLASSFAPLARDGFVVVAPQSASAGWDQPNIDRAKKVLSHLVDVLAVDEKRLHGAGFSQACGLLSSLVFDRRFHFISATWGMGGSTGGKVPRWGRKEMGVIALVGADDWARGSAEGTVGLLQKKVRNVECHVQKGIGHELPARLMPYHRYWLRVMDGRFVPGEGGFYGWTSDVDAAKATMAREKRGGFVYFYSADDTGNEEARRVQSEVFFDHLVMHYGRQAVAIGLERKAHAELFASLGLTTTPAAVVLDSGFEARKTLEAKKVTPAALAKALRSVARNRRPPEKPGVFEHD